MDLPSSSAVRLPILGGGGSANPGSTTGPRPGVASRFVTLESLMNPNPSFSHPLRSQPC